MIIKLNGDCPWYVPQAACDACEKACKEKVTPYILGALAAGVVLGWWLK